MSGDIPRKEQKILCLKSGNRCALPDCHRVLVIDGTQNDRESIIGVMAHIKGENPTAARYDPDMADKERNSYPNLLMICANCHKVIDDQPKTYTVERLSQIKAEHENWVIESMKKEVMNVTFEELATVTNYLISGSTVQNDSFVLIPPKEKIKKNELSYISEQLIIMGMTQVNQVADFIAHAPDIEFGEHLKQRFVVEYERLKNEEKLTGDDLFNSLHDFASNGNNEFKNRAAGLAVLVYLFEKCEVFEK